jgi:hypothetical protein
LQPTEYVDNPPFEQITKYPNFGQCLRQLKELIHDQTSLYGLTFNFAKAFNGVQLTNEKPRTQRISTMNTEKEMKGITTKSFVDK